MCSLDKTAFKEDIYALLEAAKKRGKHEPYTLTINKRMAIDMGLKDEESFGGARIEIEIGAN